MCNHIIHISHKTNMPNITLSVPENLHELMRKHRQIRWSEIARRAIEFEAKKMELVEQIASKSKLTMDDVMALDSKVKKRMRKHFDALNNEARYRH